MFALICALYWGEGGKSHRVGVVISNADSKLLNLFVKWLLLKRYEFEFRVRYHEGNGLTESQITEWWMNAIPSLKTVNLRKFTKSGRVGVGKCVGKLPYGTACVRVRRSTELYMKIMGGIRYLSEMVP
jgi:hypothetical protein